MANSVFEAPLLGSQPIANFFVPDTVQRHPLGTIVEANVPYYGGGEYIYLKTGETSDNARIWAWNAAYISVLNPITANLAWAIAINPQPVIVDTYSWYQISGNSPIATTSTIAAGSPVGYSAAVAGSAAPVSAGHQILSMISAAASSNTLAKQANTQLGSTRLKLYNTDGLVKGLALSGTGIPGGTTIVSINDDDTIVMSNAATATGSILLLAVFTGFIVGTYDRPKLQGQIT